MSSPIEQTALHRTSSTYHRHIREDLIPFLPLRHDLQVLELGCAHGLTGARLKEEGIARHVTGVERDPDAAAHARTVLDEVFVADLDQYQPPSDAQFDLIIAPDVVEHLVDPWSTLHRIVRHLRPGGHLLTSTPNVRYWRILYDLAVRGKWDYQSDGILDITHLRFFTRRSISRLHEDLGLHIECIGHSELSGTRLTLDRMTRGSLRDLLCGQHILRSRKA